MVRVRVCGGWYVRVRVCGERGGCAHQSILAHVQVTCADDLELKLVLHIQQLRQLCDG